MPTKPLKSPVKINLPESVLSRLKPDAPSEQRETFASLYNKAYEEWRYGDFETAIAYTSQTLKVAEINNNDVGYLHGAVLLNRIYECAGHFPKNISHLHKVFELIKKSALIPQLAAAYSSIGRVYFLLEDQSQALVYIFKSLEINNYLNHLPGLVENYTYLADLYLSNQNIDQALFYARQALYLCMSPVSDEQMISTLISLAAIHQHNQQPGSTNRRLQQARQLLSNKKFPYEKARLCLVFGEGLKDQQHNEKSIYYLSKGFDLARQIKAQTLQTRFHIALAQVYKQNQQYQLALEHYETFHQRNQKPVNATTAQQLRSLETAHKIEAYSFRNHQLKREIQERAKNQAELEVLATTDPLTGLFNRRHFISLAEHWSTKARQSSIHLAALMIDIDHFKVINDTYGHSTGDQALRQIANIIQQSLRSQDILCRYGGEEFCVLLPDTDSQASQQVAERIRQNMAQFKINAEQNYTFQVTVSIGVADSLSTPDPSIMNLLENADHALYKAKQNGRNCTTIFSPVTF